jgi:hypothetical protein
MLAKFEFILDSTLFFFLKKYFILFQIEPHPFNYHLGLPYKLTHPPP